MGCCRDCCGALFRFLLIILNLLDAAVGVTLICYAIWFTQTLDASYAYKALATLYWGLPLAIGLLLVMSAIFSFGGLSFEKCQCGLSSSALLCIPIGLLMVITGCMMLANQHDFFQYLKNNVDDDDTIDEFKTWFNVLAYGFFVTAALQLIRFGFSRKLLTFSKLDSKELRTAFLEEQSVRTAKQDQTKAEINTKYSGLRDKYREKYGTDVIRAGTGDTNGPDYA
mmetsp:Transcript_18256/g.21592  ORF Transcript_18256/g.21592 Transcript_18256/m.21592 type:complete len:225 (-) Transcript_18256:109-783(-)